MKMTGIMVLVLIGLAGAAPAADKDPVARGKELFNSKSLGSNGKSCAKCHPNGKSLEGIGSYNEQQLGEVVNSCIERSLAGKPLAADSTDLKALIAYLRTFAKP